jgi:hypothetical protein
LVDDAWGNNFSSASINPCKVSALHLIVCFVERYDLYVGFFITIEIIDRFRLQLYSTAEELKPCCNWLIHSHLRRLADDV